MQFTRAVDVCVAAFLGVTLAGCAKTDRPDKAQSVERQSTDSVTTVAAVAPLPISGPRLVVDSEAVQPFMRLELQELTLHISPEIKKTLDDRLPGFALVQRSAYEPNLVRWADECADDSREIGEAAPDSLGRYALSAAVGDFDGDSTRDVAMMGVSRDSSATVFVLSRSRARERPQLIFIKGPRPADHLNREWIYLNLVHAGPIRPFDEDGKSEPFKIPADSVEVGYFEKGAEVFFLDQGLLRSVMTSD